jgi:hypothetical protein
MFRDWRRYAVLMEGSRAAENGEPGQDRKVAAVNRTLRVTRGSPTGASDR